jgi:putative Mg2+ transporter-C (MgtC) family protein
LLEFVAALQQATAQEFISALRLDLALRLGLAVVLGGAIGLERQIAGKPAGLRTSILIALGSALLMDLSINLGRATGQGGDPARLAAQVVTGVGFLGAGTILHFQGGVVGLTSAATIWVVMAIGLTVGAGFYIEALGTTVIVVIVLTVLGRLEHHVLRAQRLVRGTIRVRKGTLYEDVERSLRDVGIRVSSHRAYDHPNDRVFEVQLRGPASQFEVAREELSRREDVLSIYLS